MAGTKSVSYPMASSVFLMIVGAIGFFAVMMLNAFVFDDFDAYGEVPVPGTGQVQLPAGEAQISFHTSSASRGFPIPPVTVNIGAPEGVADPVLTEDRGGRARVNKDAHVRIWTVDIRDPGTYIIRADGQVNGYPDPRLAVGKDSGSDSLPWVFGGVFALGLVGLMVSVVRRLRRS
ncbi:hypothetical protein FHT40_003004 [Mycolicibacterium sp. BK556]|uniref:SHOCT domain-containing protein n=1 Tax=Mycobacteriaceae TaxID=1762 RepID=UPI0010EBD654|nr:MULTISPECIES: SHOCT domain-containing protein [Mycobacteriaceae]MBB3603343.1 hypothetical protein [Mycolicibacterium sp. BK556]MBB3633538.1 hypothetical protein [Mycolicibacterium sp. BK607]MBB3751120.1 hypothetical protein [Mycolicibacterium sp. BK634]TDO11657.1 hypothetical protein EV580_3375 [Mycobacterium sp. BK086]